MSSAKHRPFNSGLNALDKYCDKQYMKKHNVIYQKLHNIGPNVSIARKFKSRDTENGATLSCNAIKKPALDGERVVMNLHQYLSNRVCLRSYCYLANIVCRRYNTMLMINNHLSVSNIHHKSYTTYIKCTVAKHKIFIRPQAIMSSSNETMSASLDSPHKASDAELWCFLWSTPEQMAEQKIETPVN